MEVNVNGRAVLYMLNNGATYQFQIMPVVTSSRNIYKVFLLALGEKKGGGCF